MLTNRTFTFALGLLLLACPHAMAQESGGQSKAAKKKVADAAKAELVVGADAPDWSLPGSDGKTYKLSDYKNKQAVVVFWYPMALTGG